MFICWELIELSVACLLVNGIIEEKNHILHSSISKCYNNSASGWLMQFVARFNIMALKLLWQQKDYGKLQLL